MLLGIQDTWQQNRIRARCQNTTVDNTANLMNSAEKNDDPNFFLLTKKEEKKKLNVSHEAVSLTNNDKIPKKNLDALPKSRILNL